MESEEEYSEYSNFELEDELDCDIELDSLDYVLDMSSM